jgi:hypothetical protein
MQGVRCLLAGAFDAGLLARDQGRARWSLAMIGLDGDDTAALSCWFEQLHESHVQRLLGSIFPADITLPSAYGNFTLSNEAAFGLLFLALAAVIARRSGDAKDVWTHVASLPCRPAVRDLLFTPGDQPRANTKSAIREAADRLRLRTPGEDRDLHWYYRTILLQIGLTAAAAVRLPVWVADRRRASTAVQALLDPDPNAGLYDARFARMWAAFGALLNGGDRSQAVAEVAACGWVPSELIETYVDELKRAGAQRVARSGDVEGPVGTPYFELSPTLRLVVRPIAFRDERVPGVVDLFLDGERRARFLRQRDGSLVERRSVNLWSDDDEVVCLDSNDPSRSVVLVDAFERPCVEPSGIPIARYADRWAVVAPSSGCTVRADGEIVWTERHEKPDAIDVQIALGAPFTASSPGTLIVSAATPLRIHAVRVEGHDLSLAECGEQRWTATGVIDAHPLGPSARVHIVVDGPRGRRSARRRMPLLPGAWIRN